MTNSFNFIVTTSSIDPSTQTAYYSSTSGRTGVAPTFTGTELNSSRLRGYLLAATQGLRFLSDTSDETTVDLIVPDAAIAAEIRTRKPGRSILHGDSDTAWDAYLKAAEGFTVNVVESHGDSAIAAAYWAWHSRPGLQADAPSFTSSTRAAAPIVNTPPPANHRISVPGRVTADEHASRSRWI